MLSIDPAEGPVMRVRANGVLKTRDYRRFEREFAHELSHMVKPIPVLLDLSRFRGWTIGGLARDLIWDMANRTTFSKIAVVGHARWHRWITWLAMPVFQAELKYFRVLDEQLAEQWLEQPLD